MKIPEYVTRDEVRRVCRELGIRDWSRLKKASVTAREARAILRHVGIKGLKVDPEQFRIGLEVELEHGTMFRECNVTNNHPILTGKIVIAHMLEMLDYYMRLEVAELEGDLLKALSAGDVKKARNYARRASKAREGLSKAEARKLRA
jgi:glycine cleavage system aminomethyltransferase T